LARAVRGATGFLYLISRLGVTGARDRVPPDLAEHVARVRAASPLPLAVGFGISTPAQARATAQLADGVVVGSALVDALGSGALTGGLVVGVPATALAITASVLTTDWLWHKKMFTAALVNLGREVLALVGAYGVYALIVRAAGVAPGLHVEMLLPLVLFGLAYFGFSRLLFYFALTIRGKLERDERMLIFRYECISFGATIIAAATLVGTVVFWPPEVWLIVAALLTFLGLL